jgi:hypothetical protein
LKLILLLIKLKKIQNNFCTTSNNIFNKNITFFLLVIQEKKGSKNPAPTSRELGRNSQFKGASVVCALKVAIFAAQPGPLVSLLLFSRAQVLFAPLNKIEKRVQRQESNPSTLPTSTP